MRIILALLLVFSTAACSGGGSLGNLNLFGWLGPGGGQNSFVQDRGLAPRGGFTANNDSRPVVGSIAALVADRTATGTIIRARAVLPSEGYYAADLVLTGISTRGLATYELRARPPAAVSRNVPVHLREISVAVHLTRAQIQYIRQVQVQGAANSRTVSP